MKQFLQPSIPQNRAKFHNYQKQILKDYVAKKEKLLSVELQRSLTKC
jgi:hypothetical protein